MRAWHSPRYRGTPYPRNRDANPLQQLREHSPHLSGSFPSKGPKSGQGGLLVQQLRPRRMSVEDPEFGASAVDPVPNGDDGGGTDSAHGTAGQSRFPSAWLITAKPAFRVIRPI